MFALLVLLATLAVPPPFTAKLAPNYAAGEQQYFGAVTLENQTLQTLTLTLNPEVDPADNPDQLSISAATGPCPEEPPPTPATAMIKPKDKRLEISIVPTGTRCLTIGPLSKSAVLVFSTANPSESVQRVALSPSLIQLSPLNATVQQVDYWWPWKRPECDKGTTKSLLTSPEGRTMAACLTALEGEPSGQTVTVNSTGRAAKYSGILSGVTTAKGGEVTATVTLKHHWGFAVAFIVAGLLFAAWREFLRSVAPAAIDLAEKSIGLPQALAQVGPYQLNFQRALFIRDVNRRRHFFALGPTQTLDTLEVQRVAAASWGTFGTVYRRLVTLPGTGVNANAPILVPAAPIWYEAKFKAYVPTFNPAWPVGTAPLVVTLLNDLAGLPKATTIESVVQPADFDRALSLMRDATTIASLIEELDLVAWRLAVKVDDEHAPAAAKIAFRSLERALYSPGIEPGPNLSAADMSAYARRLVARFDRFLAALVLLPGAVADRPFIVAKLANTTASAGGIASGMAVGDAEDDGALLGKKVALWRSRRGALLLWSALTLAVVAGLQALYFTDAPWGSLFDYVVALAWGGLVYTGLSSLTDALNALRDPLRKNL